MIQTMPNNWKMMMMLTIYILIYNLMNFKNYKINNNKMKIKLN